MNTIICPYQLSEVLVICHIATQTGQVDANYLTPSVFIISKYQHGYGAELLCNYLLCNSM